ncbi:MAG TPA: phosphoenolpyruvate carboxykinase (ATP) [Chloroflexota bacterium]|nr:phosphoenolpyruvate carboxykinase (ATP) [Chloroflexota bacterium]
MNRLRAALAELNIRAAGAVHHNLAAPQLYELAVTRAEGLISESGAIVVETGQHTGRSPGDKFVVRHPEYASKIWWGPVNQPIEPGRFEELYGRVTDYLSAQDTLFVQDCFVNAEPRYRLPVRAVGQTAWHSLFARNMFIPATSEELVDYEPQFTIVHAPLFEAEPARDGTKTGTFIALDFAKRVVVIGGTRYAGEMKKSVFTLLNYLLPEQGVLSMHCSANVGADGRSAIFFGLSGTGKTTLSADPARTLIGDDEHGWGEDGVFNFEGGCYAKVIRLSATAEPDIYEATHRFGTVLENVVIDPATRKLDLDDESLTENTRSCYPISYIRNASRTGVCGHPSTVLMLTADAFGVLPPIGRLTPEQAMYHFLLGYTARVAGTERGVTEPQPTFSTCFGAPFLPLPPARYAEMLARKIKEHNVDVWLVNTGWTGGPAGTGHRMPIAHTRAMVAAALDGSLGKAPVTPDPFFGLGIPQSCPGVPSEVLQPRLTWSDPAAYDATATRLARSFDENFAPFAPTVSPEVRAAGPRVS